MLAEAFGVLHINFFASLLVGLFHGDDVLVHAVMFEEPVALAGVAAEHFFFGLSYGGDIDEHGRFDLLAKVVDAVHWVGVVKVRNVVVWWDVVGFYVGYAGGEAGGFYELTGYFVVGHVIDGAGREDQGWFDLTDDLDGGEDCGAIIEDEDVILVGAMIWCVENGGGGDALLVTNLADFIGA